MEVAHQVLRELKGKLLLFFIASGVEPVKLVLLQVRWLHLKELEDTHV